MKQIETQTKKRVGEKFFFLNDPGMGLGDEFEIKMIHASQAYGKAKIENVYWAMWYEAVVTEVKL